MAKRKHNPRRRRRFSVQKQDSQWLDRANRQLQRQDFAGLAQTCQRVLSRVSPNSPEYADALEYLSTAYTMLKQFEKAYQALSELLEINPHPAYLWHNRAMLGRYTLRLVPAIRDLEKAVALERDGAQREKFSQLLAETQKMAESERALRGPEFTLEQLEEQQELFLQALQLMNQKEWAAAAQTFRRVIDLGECLPQPSGNLGLALLMQGKYDEAEAAFKRALEIDPSYDLARQHLESIPRLRQTGQTPSNILLRDPFAAANINLNIQ